MTRQGVPGIIIEIRPKALFRVRLQDGRVITANVERSLRHILVRLVENQKVLVRLSTHDPNRGQITQLSP